MSESELLRKMIHDSAAGLLAAVAPVPDALFHQRPAPDANPVGFICFHVLRHWDRDINVRIQGKPASEDLWHREDFSAISGYNPDGKGLMGTGYGYSRAEVDEVSAGKDALLQYHRMLLEETDRLLDTLNPEDLDTVRESPGGIKLTIGGWLQHLIAHNWVHVGDIEFIKGRLGLPAASVPEIT